MIELDGIDYEIKDASQNADDMVGYINDYCKSHDVKNTLGEQIEIEKNRTSPLYMILFGLGYLVTGLQNLIYSAACSMNIARSSERQLLDLCDIAGIKRNAATKTTIKCQVFVKDTSDYLGTTTEANRILHVTKDLAVTLKSGSDNVVFHPAFETDIGTGANAVIILVAEQAGPFVFAENAFANFDSQPPQVLKIFSDAAVSGHAQETIPELRQRLIDRGKSYPITQRVSEAIAELDGVTYCNVLYNTGETTQAIGSSVLLPRHALLLVQGFSEKIAETYYTHMLAPTQEITGRSIRQVWRGAAGQEYAVDIVPPHLVPVSVDVMVTRELNSDIIERIKTQLCRLTVNLKISESLESATIVKYMHEYLADIPLVTVQMTAPGMAGFSYKTTPLPDELLVIYRENIQVSVSS